MDISSCANGSDCVDPVNEVGDSLSRALHIQDEPNADDASRHSEVEHPESKQRGLFSLPSPLNLVSAMKGGRGESTRKLSVSWAPEVYDPVPNSMSHTVNRGAKKQPKSKSNKKNWKNAKKSHKGNSSRSTTGKDKKHSRRVSVTSRPMEAQNDEFDDLTLATPDSPSNCGTSFFKKSLANVHYPVAEAL